MNTKNDLLAIYSAGLQAVEGTHAVSKKLPDILNQQFSDKELEKLRIVAIGKAADAMLRGALSVLKEHQTSSLLISKYGHICSESLEDSGILAIESAHPVPDENSLEAGKQLVSFIQQNEDPCLILISGGASSLVELLDDNWSLDELQELTQWMLSNAYSIDEMNAVRRRISCLKGGGLWSWLEDRKVICLMISDVPKDDVSIIGSGMLFPPQELEGIPDSLPAKWRDKLPDPKQLSAADTFYSEIIANNTSAREVAAETARSLGYTVLMNNELLESNAEEVAKDCVNTARANAGSICIWGAETTVNLPENPGRGGRNQHLALAAALVMNKNEECFLLSAGTDGTDGMTEDAGGLVDGQTITRGEVEGMVAREYLQNADSGTFLDATSDLISTGVTGTNVMDLIIAWSKGSK